MLLLPESAAGPWESSGRSSVSRSLPAGRRRFGVQLPQLLSATLSPGPAGELRLEEDQRLAGAGAGDGAARGPVSGTGCAPDFTHPLCGV